MKFFKLTINEPCGVFGCSRAPIGALRLIDGLNALVVGGKAGLCLGSAGFGRFGPRPNLFAKCCRLGSGLELNETPVCPDWSSPDWSRLIGGEILVTGSAGATALTAWLTGQDTADVSGAPVGLNPTAVRAGFVMAWICVWRSVWGNPGFIWPP